MISEVGSPFAHHIIIYLCDELDHTFVGASDVCDDTHLAIRTCRRGEIIASWAVGGNVRNFVPKNWECTISCLFDVQDFVFPPEVALPLGGPGAPKIIVIEMHYDNPTLQTGILIRTFLHIQSEVTLN